jgi:PPK2 family polyphosphate:nucleotide phosphotransferase
MNSGKLMVKPGSRLKLADRDPDDTHGNTKEKSARQLAAHSAKLDELQDLLYAGHKHALLIVLQALDAGGKDGTIRHVMSGVNPQSCSVTSFKAPTPEELGHDFLWRVHKAVPIHGTIGIFNRSHYEDVLIARVHNLVPKAVWSKRYGQINDFESELAASGVKILKFFLHISKEEQKKRFEARLADPSKLWKASEADFTERRFWDEYIGAFEDALSKCSTHQAPWYVIPANKKWFRNLAVSQIIIEALASLKMKYPKSQIADPSKIVIE